MVKEILVRQAKKKLFTYNLAQLWPCLTSLIYSQFSAENRMWLLGYMKEAQPV